MEREREGEKQMILVIIVSWIVDGSRIVTTTKLKRA